MAGMDGGQQNQHRQAHLVRLTTSDANGVGDVSTSAQVVSVISRCGVSHGCFK